jgi:hypothetical protein
MPTPRGIDSAMGFLLRDPEKNAPKNPSDNSSEIASASPILII